MKIFKRVLLGIALAFVCVFTLASCSKVSQSYADKINEAAKTEEKITYDEAKEALGDECFDTLNNSLITVLVAVKGYTNDMSWSEIQQKLSEADNDTKFEFITIGVAGGKCQKAIYGSGSYNDLVNAISNSK